MGMARRPVWVSETARPQKIRNTARVIRLPIRDRGGTSGWEKSRHPRISRRSSSILRTQATASSG